MKRTPLSPRAEPKALHKPVPKPIDKPKSTAQQNIDFTAEGAPPPGKVGTDVPVNAATQALIDVEQARATKATKPISN